MRNAPATILAPLLAAGVLASACRAAVPAPAPAPAAVAPRRGDCAVREITSRDRDGRMAASATRVVRADTLAHGAAASDSATYDVVLDIPDLCTKRLALRVDTLTARIAVDTRLGSLLEVSAGVNVHLGNVDLEIEGLEAEALLLVHLDDVVHVVDRTLTTVDGHPEVLGSLDGPATADIGGAAGRLLLARTRDAQGRTVVRAVDEEGRILEYTLSSAGDVVERRIAGDVLDLPVIADSLGATGAPIRRVRDAMGAVVELTLDRATGDLVAIRLVAPRP